MRAVEIANRVLRVTEGQRYVGVSFDASSIQPLAQAYLEAIDRLEKLEPVAKAASDFCAAGDMDVGFSLTEEDVNYYLQLRISVDALDSTESSDDGVQR